MPTTSGAMFVFFNFKVLRIFIFFSASFFFFSTLDEDYCLLLGFGLTVAVLRFFLSQLLQNLVDQASFPVISRAYVTLFSTRLQTNASLGLIVALFPLYKFSYNCSVSKYSRDYNSLEANVTFPGVHFLLLEFFNYLFGFYSVLFGRGIR